jgi:PKHD-type hydroxylase
MLQRIEQLLNPDETKALQHLAADGRFIDGRGSAGERVHEVKANEELERTREQTKVLVETLTPAVQRNETFRFFAWPLRMNTPLISRYVPGMEYGSHLDNPIMFHRNNEPLRTDLSITVFLSDPESYDGGELSLETQFGEQTVKLPAGDAVVYATTLRHRVTPVTRGTRLAAVAWIQSMVKDHQQRQILFDLFKVRQAIRETSAEAGEDLETSYMNLVKMWADV